MGDAQTCREFLCRCVGQNNGCAFPLPHWTSRGEVGNVRGGGDSKAGVDYRTVKKVMCTPEGSCPVRRWGTPGISQVCDLRTGEQWTGLALNLPLKEAYVRRERDCPPRPSYRFRFITLPFSSTNRRHVIYKKSPLIPTFLPWKNAHPRRLVFL